MSDLLVTAFGFAGTLALIEIVLSIVSIVGSVRVEAQLKALIQARQLNELMDAAGVTTWQPLAEIRLVKLLFALLLVPTAASSVLLVGFFVKRRIFSPRLMASLIPLTLAMVVIAVYNVSVISNSKCMQPAYRNPVFAVPPKAEGALNNLLCSAWCHLQTNASAVQSCGALPLRVALDYAARLNISEWCDPTSRQQLLLTNATQYHASSPFSGLNSVALQCAPMDGWVDSLWTLSALTPLWVAAVVFAPIALIAECYTRGASRGGDLKQKTTLGAKLVEPRSIDGGV